jgi:hypothetical protein
MHLLPLRQATGALGARSAAALPLGIRSEVAVRTGQPSGCWNVHTGRVHLIPSRQTTGILVLDITEMMPNELLGRNSLALGK